MAASDIELLQEYAQKTAEEAFTILVKRHLNLVYSAALRQTKSPQLAEEVSQSVFVDLARSAPRLSHNTVLTAWLYQVTRRTAIDVIRREARRQLREQIAVEMNAMNTPTDDWRHIEPVLDDAMAALEELDRAAVLLRYFENKSLREVGEIMGTSDDAAQKRVSRAVEWLREYFSKRSVAVGAGALAAVLSASAEFHAAPAGLAATVISASLAATTFAATATATSTKTLVMTALQKTVIAAVIAAGVATPLAIQHRAQARLSDENHGLREQLKQQADLAADNERLSHLLAQFAKTNSQGLQNEQLKELLRLRSEVGRLRAESRELAQLRAASKAAGDTPASRLRAQLEQMPEKAIPELQLLGEDKWAEDAIRGNLDTPEGVREALADLRRAAKIRFAYDMGSALTNYLQINNGQLPNDILELRNFMNHTSKDEPVDDSVFQRYELLHTGNVADVAAGESLIVEKSPVDDEYDTIFKLGTSGYTIQGVGKWSGQHVSVNLWKPGAATSQ